MDARAVDFADAGKTKKLFQRQIVFQVFFSGGNVFFSVVGFLHRSFLRVNRGPTHSHGT